MNNLKLDMQNRLLMAGFKSEIISISHLLQLQSELENLKNNEIDRDFYEDQLAGFNFHPPEELPGTKSIIIVACWQRKVNVEFQVDGKKIQVVIPPIYSYKTDRESYKIISDYLSAYKYKAIEAVLPVKSLAVHAGLAVYGRNNITYIHGWGSFFRLKAYFSDMPCPSDNWQNFIVADICKKCKSCVNNCPTQAICQDRFLIKQERCLTYFNESTNDFPDWIESGWHNSLIGCMACQDVCPLNKEVKGMSRDSIEFTDDETHLLLKGLAKAELPDNIVWKLKKLELFEDYIAVQRNLKSLIYRT
ncbi:MAG: hypothetical protein JSW33_00775 [bacterium]|nr:MAG: hypothetical protein JSW33_00775 [bacterium]